MDARWSRLQVGEVETGSNPCELGFCIRGSDSQRERTRLLTETCKVKSVTGDRELHLGFERGRLFQVGGRFQSGIEKFGNLPPQRSEVVLLTGRHLLKHLEHRDQLFQLLWAIGLLREEQLRADLLQEGPHLLMELPQFTIIERLAEVAGLKGVIDGSRFKRRRAQRKGARRLDEPRTLPGQEC